MWLLFLLPFSHHQIVYFGSVVTSRVAAPRPVCPVSPVFQSAKRELKGKENGNYIVSSMVSYNNRA